LTVPRTADPLNRGGIGSDERESGLATNDSHHRSAMIDVALVNDERRRRLLACKRGAYKCGAGNVGVAAHRAADKANEIAGKRG
jgi:hypothetical protein